MGKWKDRLWCALAIFGICAVVCKFVGLERLVDAYGKVMDRVSLAVEQWRDDAGEGTEEEQDMEAAAGEEKDEGECTWEGKEAGEGATEAENTQVEKEAENAWVEKEAEDEGSAQAVGWAAFYEDAADLWWKRIESNADTGKEKAYLEERLTELYLDWSNACLEVGECENALQVLMDGRERIDSAELAQREQYLREHIVCTGITKYEWNPKDPGTVFSETGAQRFTYDEHGNVILEEKYNPGGVLDERVEYDYVYGDFDAVIRETHYDSAAQISGWTEWKYDGAGNCLEEVCHDADGQIQNRTEWEYDWVGNCLGEVHYDADGQVRNQTGWEYNESGNCLKEVHYDSDGQVTRSTVWEYDRAGNRLKEVYYGADGQMMDQTEWEYDESGNCLKEIAFTFSDGGMEKDWEWDYDVEGNIIARRSYTNGQEISRSWEEEIYDGTGKKVIRKLVHEVEDGEDRVTGRYEYEYDDQGNPVKDLCYTYDDGEGWRIDYGNEYEYSAFGKRKKVIEYNERGEEKIIAEVDEMGNPLILEDPDMGGRVYEWYYQYDALGNEVCRFYMYNLHYYDEEEEIYRSTRSLGEFFGKKYTYQYIGDE